MLPAVQKVAVEEHLGWWRKGGWNAGGRMREQEPVGC